MSSHLLHLLVIAMMATITVVVITGVVRGLATPSSWLYGSHELTEPLSKHAS